MPAHPDIHDALNGRGPAAVDGRWALVDGYIGGVRVPEADLPGLTLTIDNGRFSIGNTEGLIYIDTGSQPGVMDIVATSGPNRGQFVAGIFEWSDEALRVCYDLSGASRPTTFESPAGTRRFVALYRRAGPCQGIRQLAV